MSVKSYVDIKRRLTFRQKVIKVHDFWYGVWCRFLTWFGDIYLAFGLPKVDAHDIREALRLVQPGDVLMRKYMYFLDGYFIPKEEFSHSGVKTEGNDMVHSVAEGVGYIDVVDFIKDADGFIILRPKYATEQDRLNAIARAHKNVGVGYDFVLSLDPSTLYCHEHTYTCMISGRISVIPLYRGIGFFRRLCVLDGDLMDMPCDIVYRSGRHSMAAIKNWCHTMITPKTELYLRQHTCL